MELRVERYLRALVDAARAVLGEELIGVYGGGSVALDAFQPGRSGNPGGRPKVIRRLAAGRSVDATALMGDLLAAMGAWCRSDGPPPYPLAEACTDHQIALAIGESARTGGFVTTTAEGWSDAASGEVAA